MLLSSNCTKKGHIQKGSATHDYVYFTKSETLVGISEAGFTKKHQFSLKLFSMTLSVTSWIIRPCFIPSVVKIDILHKLFKELIENPL